MIESRIGGWIQTHTGKQIWPLDLRAEDVCIEDIAHHLSLQCRFSGACRVFYSVAEHSVRVASHVREQTLPRVSNVAMSYFERRRLCLRALLHDASEAYLQDVVRPIKRHESMAFYKDAERRAMRTICEVFNVVIEEPSIVTQADAALLLAEKRDLLGPSPAEWSEAQGRAGVAAHGKIDPWAASLAETMFLEAFQKHSR